VNELLAAPALSTVLIGMKLPAPSVGMSAKNATFTVKVEQVDGPPAAGSTTLTRAPTTAGAPGGGLTNINPPAVTVTIIWVGTPVCTVPVSGLVQVVVPFHCIDELVNDVKLIASSVESSAAIGNAPECAPQ
jgi:hypothetical protein